MILSWTIVTAHAILGWFGHNQPQQQAPPTQVIYEQAPPPKKSGGMNTALLAGMWP